MIQWIYLAAVTAVIGVMVLLGFLICRKKSALNAKKKAAAMFALFLVFSVFSEFFVFNNKFFLTKGYTPVDMLAGSCTVEESDGAVLLSYTFDDPGIAVHNIYIDAGTLFDKKANQNQANKLAKDYTGDDEAVTVTVIAVDSANSKGITLPSRTEVSSVVRSRYIPLSLTDKVSSVTVKLTCSDKSYTPALMESALNQPVPLMFSFIRTALIFLGLCLLYIFRPSGTVCSVESGTHNALERTLSVVMALLTVGAVFCTLWANGAQCNGLLSHHKQYQKLARSISQGNVSIGDAPEFLAQMDDPYDTNARSSASKAAGKDFSWDTAYFNGKYYVYFGVVPCVLTFLPYYQITGKDLPNWVSFLIFAAVFTAAAFLIMRLLIRRLCPKFPFAFYLILASVGVYTSVVMIAKHADLYSIPIMSAVAFAVTGLLLWLFSLRHEDQPDPVALLFGSFSMALVAGCRPQVFLAAALALPIFWSSVFKKRTLFSKRGLPDTLCLVLPFLAVALLLMFYNLKRFGSPFDFGANYNLTSNDMTVRGFKVGRLGTAIYSYFLQLPVTSVLFPFIKSANLSESEYMGTTIFRAMYGSAFAICALTWFLPFAYTRRGRLLTRRNGAFAPIVIFCVSSVIIAVLDSEMAGILCRYYDDFMFMLVGAAILVMLTVYNAAEGKGFELRLRRLMFAAAVITVVVDAALMCVNDESSMHDYNADLYYRLMYAVSFWL